MIKLKTIIYLFEFKWVLLKEVDFVPYLELWMLNAKVVFVLWIDKSVYNTFSES